VTEIRLTAPATLSLNRVSSLGFTAFELLQLARWIDGEDFPRWTVRQSLAKQVKDAQ
jgi:hypothetical protein